MTVLMHELTSSRSGIGISTPAKVLDIELSRPLADIGGLDRYRCALALVRLDGSPIGYVTLPIKAGRCEAVDTARAVVDQLSDRLLRQMVRRRLDGALPESGVGLDELFTASARNSAGIPRPLVSIVVCTRDRPDHLTTCLESIRRLDYSPLEVIVVDNASATKETEALVRGRFPDYRYAWEPRPGVNTARNTGIEAAGGEIIAFTDDDARVDPYWLDALVRVLSENPSVSVVTGLVVPAELETEPQLLVEKFEGFSRRFSRSWHRRRTGSSSRCGYHLHAARLGTACNMAVRAEVFRQIGGFDPALECGVGDDIDFLFRAVEEGHTLVNEPAAVVHHFHRRTDGQLREQVARAGRGFVTLLTKAFLDYPRLRRPLIGVLLLWWAQRIGALLLSAASPGHIPPALIRAHLWHSLSGVHTYLRSRRRAATRGLHSRVGDTQPAPRTVTTDWNAHGIGGPNPSVALRAVDLTRPVTGFDDVGGQGSVRVSVRLGDRLLGVVEIDSDGAPVSADELRNAIGRNLDVRLLAASTGIEAGSVRAELRAALRTFLAPDGLARASSAADAAEDLISVVVPTYDRPEQLRRCLRGLLEQDLEAEYEIIVVDSHPDSGLTPAAVEGFAGVRLLSCDRSGASAARNAGFRASRGGIIAMTDDDVVVPPDWLRNLSRSFVRADVGAVFGRVLPYALRTRAQRAFEQYRSPPDGLASPAAGSDRIEAGPRWFAGTGFRPPPVWILGMTANAAIRRCVLENPLVGFLNESLGPGTPSGAGEDPYLIYRTLKEGHTVLYDPEVYVLHEHRESMRELHQQVYNYGKSLYAFLLTTAIRDGDLRALPFLLLTVPRIQLRKLLQPQSYPKSLLVAEVLGNLAGPFGLMRARRRLKKRLRRSADDTVVVAPVSEE